MSLFSARAGRCIICSWAPRASGASSWEHRKDDSVDSGDVSRQEVEEDHTEAVGEVGGALALASAAQAFFVVFVVCLLQVHF